MVVPKSVPTAASGDIFMAVSKDVTKADPESALKDYSKVEPRTATNLPPSMSPSLSPSLTPNMPLKMAPSVPQVCPQDCIHGYPKTATEAVPKDLSGASLCFLSGF